MDTIIVGVDPGLVHTGLVTLRFDTNARELTTTADVISGLDADATVDTLLDRVQPRTLDTIDVFIEKYRPRSNFSTDERLVQANLSFSNALQGELVLNHGVVKIVSRELLELLHLWQFQQRTHHQDLRSAARIAVLGMMRDKQLNRLLYEYTTDNIDGRTWHVRAEGQAAGVGA